MAINNISEDDFLSLSGIQHFAYCRRQWALIHIEQQWVDNYLTSHGHLFHNNAHDGRLREKRGDIIICRALPVKSTKLGLFGICDVVEFRKAEEGMTLPGETALWEAYPVEYKRGRPKKGQEDIVQVIAQAIALEEMLEYPVSMAAIYYGQTKHRFEIEITQEHRNRVFCMAMEMHGYFDKKYTPKVKKSSKCKNCSLNSICWRGFEISVGAYLDEVINQCGY